MSQGRRLPWPCGCHDSVVFGHLYPCVWGWDTPPSLRARRLLRQAQTLKLLEAVL